MKSIHPTVKVKPGVHLLGQISIGERSSVWYNAVIRGDLEPITIGNYSNVQDNCVLHSSKGFRLFLGDYISIGHAAVVHGAIIEDNCIIGMNATLLNGCKIGKNSIIGAGTVVTEGKEFPSESLIIGVPGKVVRKVTEEQIEMIKQNAIRYAELAVKESDENEN